MSSKTAATVLTKSHAPRAARMKVATIDASSRDLVATIDDVRREATDVVRQLDATLKDLDAILRHASGVMNTP